MDETTLDEITLYDEALDETGRLVAAVTADQLSRPSPCTGWDLGRLLAHLTTSLRQFTRQLDGLPMDFQAEPEVAADPVAAYHESAAALRAAWHQPGRLESEITMFGQPTPAATVLAWQLAEILLHGWDVARTIGQQPGYDDAAVAAAAGFVTRNMPTERPPGSGFQPPTEPPAGASALDQLAAFSGRVV
ncbi:MAG TPA: TIGR03086 family metal-binding protein [Mycobacteriales bacterium]|nr:TIGR03086 family metal-binding protein [Mycobacteriales bacterium]